MKTSLPLRIRRHVAPAILAYSQKEVREKLRFINREFPSAHIHVDVMDGIFVNALCYCTPTAFSTLKQKHTFEAHLMVAHPLRSIQKWKKAGATRIIFHIESLDEPRAVIAAIRKAGMEAAVAINPHTPLSRARLIFPLVDAILLMGVVPGYAGQAFIQKVFRKVGAARRSAPKATLIVDGGVTKANAGRLLRLGADQLVSTSMIGV